MAQQPAPRVKGQHVPSVLIKFVWTLSMPRLYKQQAIDLIHARDRLGKQKYGQSLMSDDGRDEVQDAWEELGDLMQYLMSARINKRDVSKIRALLPILEALCD